MKRIQRKRSKGWRMPANSVCVSRPSKWGNPWRVSTKPLTWDSAFTERTRMTVSSREEAIVLYRRWIDDPQNPLRSQIRELRGKDLCCWCSLDAPCHADALLDLAAKASGR